MEEKKVMPIPEYFSVIKDPGIDRRKKYPLNEIIAVTVLAVMSFAQGREDIERFGKARKKRLSKFFKLEHGIPPHGVYRRVFCVLKPKEIEKCFMNRVRAVKKNVDSGVSAIGGKTVRGSFNAVNGAKPIHPVSAWATANKLVSGQIKTADHGNEITAIPSLPDMIATEGRVITIGATGCRYGIAGKTIKGKADFLFSLKGNRGSPRDGVKEFLTLLILTVWRTFVRIWALPQTRNMVLITAG